MKTIPYKQTELTLIPSDKGCWGCYFLSKEMGCHCPRYLECTSRQVFSEVEKCEISLSDVVCHEDVE
ncbi:MAG: hypothetical protein WC401_05370 [Bacteroidales bacterium]